MFTIDHVNKIYSNGKGLFDVSFSCPTGSITAVIGPNGAGKSTLFNTINGLQLPDSGHFTLDNAPLSEIKPCDLGFLPEADFLISHLTVEQMLCYLLQMKNLPILCDEIQYLTNGFSLHDRMNQKISSLSQGLKKRVSIVCAVMGSPRLIVMDEPLNALDIQSVFFLKELLLRRKGDGCHILISSHILSFLDGLVTQSVFLKDGKIEQITQNNAKSNLEQIYRAVYHLENQENSHADN